MDIIAFLGFGLKNAVKLARKTLAPANLILGKS